MKKDSIAYAIDLGCDSVKVVKGKREGVQLRILDAKKQSVSFNDTILPQEIDQRYINMWHKG